MLCLISGEILKYFPKQYYKSRTKYWPSGHDRNIREEPWTFCYDLKPDSETIPFSEVFTNGGSSTDICTGFADEIAIWTGQKYIISNYYYCEDTRRRRRRGESIIITLITINNFKFNSFVGIDETIKGVGRHTNNGITGKQVIIFKPRRLLWKDGIFFLSYPFIVRINFINDNGINFISPLNASLP
ncbi:hypothetical protein OROGR_019494 [Orobanche gracilis]